MKQKSTGTHKSTAVGALENTEKGTHLCKKYRCNQKLQKASRIPQSLI